MGLEPHRNDILSETCCYYTPSAKIEAVIDIRQNKKYAQYLRRQNWIAEEHNGVFYYIKKILFFSVIKAQRPKNIDIKIIKRLSKKYRAVQVVIEPNNKEQELRVKKLGFKHTSPYIPSKTVVLQLAKPLKNIFEGFNKDTRYSIRKSENIKVSEEQDLENFKKHWKKTVDYKRYVLSIKQIRDLREAFGKGSLFLVADNNISGAIFLVAGDVGYYWHGFVNKEGRKRLSQYKVVWEGIKWAKGRGAKYFDMEGIFDERFPLKIWKGFTKFKKGFGGSVVEYPGAYQKIMWPF